MLSRKNTGPTKRLLCLNCASSYVIEGKVSCEEGKFENVPLVKAQLFVPVEFDCEEWTCRYGPCDR